MLSKLRSRLTYANIVSSLALFLALGGGAAYAAATIGSEDVIDESLQTQDVKNGSLRNADLGVAVRSDRQRSDNTCGKTRRFVDCARVSIDLPRRQRLLLMASGEWESARNDNPEGQCVIQIDDGSSRTSRQYGEVATAPSSPFNLAMNTSTGLVDAGPHRVDLTCRTTEGTMKQVKRADLTVVALGDG